MISEFSQDSPNRLGWIEQDTVRASYKNTKEKLSEEDFVQYDDYENPLLTTEAKEHLFYEELIPQRSIGEEPFEKFFKNVEKWKASSSPSKATQFIESALQHAWGVKGDVRGDYERLSVDELGNDVVRAAEMCVLASQEVVRDLYGESFEIYRANHQVSRLRLNKAFLMNPTEGEFSYKDNTIVNYSPDNETISQFARAKGHTVFIERDSAPEEVGLAPDIALPVGMNDDEAEFNLVGLETVMNASDCQDENMDAPYSYYVENGEIINNFDSNEGEEFVRNLVSGFTYDTELFASEAFIERLFELNSKYGGISEVEAAIKKLAGELSIEKEDEYLERLENEEDKEALSLRDLNSGDIVTIDGEEYEVKYVDRMGHEIVGQLKGVDTGETIDVGEENGTVYDDYGEQINIYS